jgi:peptide/nickel transport system substrate-binding protein
MSANPTPETGDPNNDTGGVPPMKSTKTLVAAACAALLALALAACGSSSTKLASNDPFSTGGAQNPKDQPLTGGKRGGVLEVLNETEFEHIDPGLAYYNIDYEVVFATQRPIMVNKPNTYTEAVPDMAASAPEVSADGKTVTVHLKPGIHYSPPVNREVTSEDVAYAIERGTNENVANPYIPTYFKMIEGIPSDKGGPVKGIVTPDKHTIVFHLSEPKAHLLVEALIMPITAAVPKEYAEKFDKHKPSDYGNFQVATGPYMFKNDKSGKVLGIGYVPGKSATLVRNPNWNAATDVRPAYLDEIRQKTGGSNPIIGRQVLSGTNVVQNELPAQSTVKLAYEKYKSQLEISPGSGSHYTTLNTSHGPFTNINLRRAVWAATNRVALNRVRGGTLVTTVQTHFIYPGIRGFEEAGGVKGPKFDFNEFPEGNKKVADKYMKLAGYPSGKYTGGKTITVVGESNPPGKEDAEITDQTLKSLGFTTKLTLVDSGTRYAKYCNVPKEEIDVCPSVGWIADFADAQTVLNITFNGKSIVSTGNVNQSQTNVPRINAAMTAAESINAEPARRKAWAKIDEEIVENASAVPIDWDKQANVEGSTVKGVGDLWDTGEWDYSWTSLK